jgi:hypothetical protein
LHHIPIVAAIMLSDHCQKGDTIEILMPYAEEWNNVRQWVYLQDTEVTEGMAKLIRFLNGDF